MLLVRGNFYLLQETFAFASIDFLLQEKCMENSAFDGTLIIVWSTWFLRVFTLLIWKLEISNNVRQLSAAKSYM